MEATVVRQLKQELKKQGEKLDRLLALVEKTQVEKTYSKKEACSVLGISLRQLGRLLDESKISSVRVGRKVFIPAESLLRYQQSVGLA